MRGHLSPTAARRVFLVLTATRWFPVGLTIGILTLFQLERGLSVAQALGVSAISGWVVLFLELPTSSFADVFGRRPVYLAPPWSTSSPHSCTWPPTPSGCSRSARR